MGLFFNKSNKSNKSNIMNEVEITTTIFGNEEGRERLNYIQRPLREIWERECIRLSKRPVEISYHQESNSLNYKDESGILTVRFFPEEAYETFTFLGFSKDFEVLFGKKCKGILIGESSICYRENLIYPDSIHFHKNRNLPYEERFTDYRADYILDVDLNFDKYLEGIGMSIELKYIINDYSCAFWSCIDRRETIGIEDIGEIAPPKPISRVLERVLVRHIEREVKIDFESYSEHEEWKPI